MTATTLEQLLLGRTTVLVLSLPSECLPLVLSGANSTAQCQQVPVLCQECLHILLPRARGQVPPRVISLLQGTTANDCPTAGQDCGSRISRHFLPSKNPLANLRSQHDSDVIPCCRVPGANDRRIAGGGHGKRDPKEWCTRIFLDAKMQVVYVAMRGSVYGFRVRDAERIYDWEDIHEVAAAHFCVSCVCGDLAAHCVHAFVCLPVCAALSAFTFAVAQGGQVSAA